MICAAWNALDEVQRHPIFGRHEGLDSGQLRGLYQLKLPDETGAGDHADDGVDPCTQLQGVIWSFSVLIVWTLTMRA